MTTGDQSGTAIIRIAEEALSKGERLALDALPKESGGILAGWWEGGSTVVVVGVLPVPDHAAGWSHYERRHSLAQESLDAYLGSHSDPRLGYVGEWHSHPVPQPPSSTDRDALTAIVKKAKTRTALVVLAVQAGNGVEAHGLVGHPRWPRRAGIEVAVIERMSS